MPTLMQGSKAPCLPDWAKGRREQTRHPALLLCYSLPWSALPPWPPDRSKAEGWARWFLCHRIRHFFQICCLWQKHFNTQEPNTETQKCFLTTYYICWEFETLFCVSKAEKSYSKLFCCSTSSLKLTTLKTWPSLILERGMQDYPIITQQKMLYLNPVSTHLSLQPEHVAEGTGEHNHLGTRLSTNSSHAWGLPDPLGW